MIGCEGLIGRAAQACFEPHWLHRVLSSQAFREPSLSTATLPLWVRRRLGWQGGLEGGGGGGGSGTSGGGRRGHRICPMFDAQTSQTCGPGWPRWPSSLSFFPFPWLPDSLLPGIARSTPACLPILRACGKSAAHSDKGEWNIFRFEVTLTGFHCFLIRHFSPKFTVLCRILTC